MSAQGIKTRLSKRERKSIKREAKQQKKEVKKEEKLQKKEERVQKKVQKKEEKVARKVTSCHVPQLLHCSARMYCFVQSGLMLHCTIPFLTLLLYNATLFRDMWSHIALWFVPSRPQSLTA